MDRALERGALLGAVPPALVCLGYLPRTSSWAVTFRPSRPTHGTSTKSSSSSATIDPVLGFSFRRSGPAPGASTESSSSSATINRTELSVESVAAGARQQAKAGFCAFLSFFQIGFSTKFDNLTRVVALHTILKVLAIAVLKKIGEEIIAANSQAPATASVPGFAHAQMMNSGNISHPRRRKACKRVLAQSQCVILIEKAV